MGRKKKPPTEPNPANLQQRGHGEPALVSCWHCEFKLPGLFFPSCGGVWLDATQTEGWVIDGDTLRLKADSQARYRHVREVARTSDEPHVRDTMGAKLARKAHRTFIRTRRDGPLLPKEPMTPAPARIQCPRCPAINLIAEPHDIIAARHDVE